MIHFPPVEILHVSHADIERSGLAASDMNEAVRAAFEEAARGQAFSRPKLALPVSSNLHFAGKGGVLRSGGYAAVKWYGLAGNNARHDLPDLHPVVVLSSAETGMPLAFIDGRWLTGMRTAAISAVAASILARPQSRRVGFVGCGTQAESHLEALLAAFPIETVVTYSRTTASAERLAARARGLGLEATVATQPEQAMMGPDIVVSSVPKHSGRTKFLDAGQLAPGALAIAVDLGYGWRADSLLALDQVFTDELEPGTSVSPEVLNFEGTFTAGLDELLADPSRWRADGSARRAFVFAGSGIADVAAAALVYERVLERGLGRRIEL